MTKLTNRTRTATPKKPEINTLSVSCATVSGKNLNDKRILEKEANIVFFSRGETDSRAYTSSFDRTKNNLARTLLKLVKVI